MNSTRRLWCAAVLWCVALGGCTPDDAAGELLWNVRSPNGGQAYLFGTIHSMLLNDAREKHPGAMAKFDASEVLVVELDADSVDVGAYSERAMRADGAPTLDTQLTSTEWQALVDETQKVFPTSTTQRMEPWYAAQMFALCARYHSCAPASSMDVDMAKTARERGSELRFLETWQQQVTALEQATDLEQLKATLATEPSALNHATTTLEVAWSVGDAKGLQAALETTRAESRRVLFDERNERWAQELDTLLRVDGRPVFVAVGAGHLLGGEKSLPALLRKQGFTVLRQPEP